MFLASVEHQSNSIYTTVTKKVKNYFLNNQTIKMYKFLINQTERPNAKKGRIINAK